MKKILNIEQTNRKYMAIIDFLRKFITIFFSIFFNIYILKIVNNDFNFILKYTIFGVIIEFVLVCILLKIINSKNAKTIYRLSFPLMIFCILLLIVFKENIVSYIFMFKTIYALARTTYSVPFELVIIGSNDKNTMSNFLANLNILSAIATILTPVFSGFIIDRFSYNILFILLSIETLIIIIISLNIKDFTVNNKKLELNKFWKLSKDNKPLKYIYKSMFYRRISLKGVIDELLPIILFLRLGTELDLGTYNSIFAIISIISLQILKIINSKKIDKKFYPYLAIVIFISSIVVVCNSGFLTLLIYYILMNSFGTIIESESCSLVYETVKNENLVEYKKEHILVYNIYMVVGQVVSYSLVYILYNYFYNLNIFSIAVSALMFFLIIAAIYLQKTENSFRENNV